MRRALALSLIIPAGYALGLALGPVPGDRILVSALLFSLMTASIADADFRHLRPRDALKGVALSYGLGGAAVALTSILVPAGVLRRGFLVIAFTPIMAGMRNGGLAAVTVALIAGYAPTLPIILSGPFEFAIPGIAELVRSHKEGRK